MADETVVPKTEKELLKFHPSRLNWWFWYLVAALCIITLIPLLIGLIVIIYIELRRSSTTYTVTDRRLVKEVGIMGKSTTSTIYKQITDIHMRQSFIQQLLGIGTIGINTAGTSGIEIMIRGIANAPQIKKTIEDAWSESK